MGAEMAGTRRSLQDLIRSRQQGGFVGRQGQRIQYRENLELDADDERRRFLFNVHGDAGVGKTYLTRQLQQIARDCGALTAYLDESCADALATMSAIAEQFRRADAPLASYDKRSAAYQQRRHDIEADPSAPEGVAAFVTKTAVTVGLHAVRAIPVAGSVAASIDPTAAADQVDRARTYLAAKIRDHRDVRLILSPVDELTPVFVTALNEISANRPIALFFDTYERTSPVLDGWLRALYGERYGGLPEGLVTTISGQLPLSPNLWSDYLAVIADIPLEPFSDAEARQFLASKDITDEATIEVILTLSGRLPLWLATLAEARPDDAAEIGDPAGGAVERFLKWEEDPNRRQIAITAALPRTLNQDILAVLEPTGQAPDLFGWLIGMPFVSKQADCWKYHEVARTAMLRLQRAQSPSQWRANQAALAQAHQQWAAEAAGNTDKDWSNPDWIDHTREATYHTLCADPAGNLTTALTSAVKAADESLARARQWAELITDAGRDTDNPALRTWGQRLLSGVSESDSITYLSHLIDYPELGQETLVTALYRRSRQHGRADNYVAALADLTRAIELNPSDARAIASRGETYRLMARYDDARTDLTRAIELNPSDAWAIASRGDSYRLMERYDDARTDLTRAIELNPSDAWAIVSRGLTYAAMGRYDDAITDLTRAIELNPSYTWAIASRGETYWLMGRDDDALTDFTRAIELNPSYTWAIASRSKTYQRMGRYRDALTDLTDLTRATELDETDAEHWYWRSKVYLALGRNEEAQSDLSRASAGP